MSSNGEEGGGEAKMAEQGLRQPSTRTYQSNSNPAKYGPNLVWMGVGRLLDNLEWENILLSVPFEVGCVHVGQGWSHSRARCTSPEGQSPFLHGLLL